MTHRPSPVPDAERDLLSNVRDRWLAGPLTLALPAAFIVLSLVALLAVPVLGDRYTGPVRREIRQVAEPARSLLTDVHLAVALEGTALRDLRETGDAEYVRQYRSAAGRERLAYERLEVLVPRLGSDVEGKFALLRDLESRWHARVERFIAEWERRPDGAAATRADPVQAELYEDLLVAAGRLDDAIARAVRFWRQRLLAAESLERRLSLAVGVLALAAIVVAVWLGRRLRGYAADAERRREELERVLEGRSRLMRGLSHDLKNPLHAINGHATLLLEGVDGDVSDAHRRSVTRIKGCVRDMLGLIGDLMEVTRAESGQLEIERQPVNLHDVLAELVDEHRPEARVAGHELCLVTAHDLPTLSTDPHRVRQVLGNLVSNAIKYATPGGAIIVRADVRDEERDRHRAGRVAVRVSDEGPGIAEAEQERIFDEFTRLDRTGKPGSGLGLAIARRVARLLGGDVTVTSAIGRASTFTLWLPATEPPGSAAPSAGRDAALANARTPQPARDQAAAALHRDTTSPTGDASWKTFSRNGRSSHH